MEVVQLLVAILKLMKNPRANMLDLLDTICTRSSPETVERAWGNRVKLSCPNHQDSHQVFWGDFLLLEAVEGAFGTTEQKLEAISSYYGMYEPKLSALASRLARQQEKLTFLNLYVFDLESKESAEAFKTLMQASSKISITEIAAKTIGSEGWKVVAEALRLHPGVVIEYVAALKDDLDEASHEDIRVIWDAMETDGVFIVWLEEDHLWEEVVKTEGGGGWTRLTKIMEMSKQEWVAQLEDEGEGEEEEESETEEEEEGEAEEEDGDGGEEEEEGEGADGALGGDNV